MQCASNLIVGGTKATKSDSFKVAYSHAFVMKIW